MKNLLQDNLEGNVTFKKIFVTYYARIVYFAFQIIGDREEAEDIAQDVFLQLIKSNKEFENEEHLRAWLFRIAINKSKNLLKSFWISHRSDFPTENTSIHEKDYDLILSVLELEPKYRIPIHLFYYEGYSIKEISAILHEKEATIGTRLDRARKKLKDKLGSDYYGS